MTEVVSSSSAQRTQGVSTDYLQALRTAERMDYTIEFLSPFTEYTIELFVRNEAGLEGGGCVSLCLHIICNL